MIPPAYPTVTVVVCGRIVEGSTSATLRHGVVVAPIFPYVDDIATIVARDPAGDSIIFERGGRTFRVAVGSPSARGDDALETLPIAPYLRAGVTIIPLAAVARALGATVVYDPESRTLHVDLLPVPLATMSPFEMRSPLPGPLPTFAPTPTPAPRETVTGIPVPRRTPILEESAVRKIFR